MSTVRDSVFAIALVAAVAAGCATQDPRAPAPARPQGSAGAPTPDDCSSRVDALITQRVIPNSDREYAIGMCQAHR